MKIRRPISESFYILVWLHERRSVSKNERDPKIDEDHTVSHTVFKDTMLSLYYPPLKCQIFLYIAVRVCFLHTML
jgi:hypothetical protein